jgi:hypothetical protein
VFQGCMPMTRYLRRTSLTLAAVALVGSAALVPAPAPAGPDERSLKAKFQAVADYTEEQNWAIVIPHLQKLADVKDDAFVQLPDRTPDGKEALRRVSVRAEANRLIGALPPEGLEFYKLTYGPDALALLKEAKGDPALLGRLARRFPHTDAGQAAILLLAVYRGHLR